MTRRRVTVVEPYLAQYRVPFFERLGPALHCRDIDLTVAYGAPTGRQARRGDSRDLAGGVSLRQRALRVGGRDVLWRPLRHLVRCSDALVLDHSLRHLEIYPLLMRSRMPGGPAVGLFGHGAPCSRGPDPLFRAASSAIVRCADWYFAYTEGGARHIAGIGFPSERITVVQNAVDTAPLAAARDSVPGDRLAAFCHTHGLRKGRTALYIGGLDGPKRIPFLLEAAQRTASWLPGFRLVVAGDGEQRDLVRQAARPGRAVVYVGPASADAKALLGAAADVLLMPGAVGLAAVDSFALRTPLITTSHAAHGPEFEYVEHGRNAVIVDGGADAFARATVALLGQPARLARLRDSCRTDATRYSLEAMVERFAAGVEGLLGTHRPRRHLHADAEYPESAVQRRRSDSGRTAAYAHLPALRVVS